MYCARRSSTVEKLRDRSPISSPRLRAGDEPAHAALRVDRVLGLVAQAPQARRQARGEDEQHQRAERRTRSASPRRAARTRGCVDRAMALVVSSTTTAPTTARRPTPGARRRGSPRLRVARQAPAAGRPRRCSALAADHALGDLGLRERVVEVVGAAARGAAAAPGARRAQRAEGDAAASWRRAFRSPATASRRCSRSTTQMRRPGAREALSGCAPIVAARPACPARSSSSSAGPVLQRGGDGARGGEQRCSWFSRSSRSIASRACEAQHRDDGERPAPPARPSRAGRSGRASASASTGSPAVDRVDRRRSRRRRAGTCGGCA